MARRSLLFSPGDQPALLRKAPETGADGVIFDLEDAVAPDEKTTARDAVHEVLTDPAFDPDCEVCVRLDPVGAGAAADVAAVLDGDPRLDSVMLPKVSDAADVTALGDLLADHGAALSVLAIVESAAAVLAAEDIARADPTDALVFGAEDLAVDIGAARSVEGGETMYARQRVVLAASAAGVDALDSIHADIEDTEGLAADATTARRLGFDGKVAIHPDQIPVINDAFTPPAERVEWAERVLEASEAAAAEGRGVVRVDGEMVDAPVVARAERVLELARAGDDR
ncbi:HpcH/HpaI aldolase/citrate lyase family protein [Halorientalis litorea]|uniref:HpcH/HpaI aldolase/citrate lyase family protein n=1 Tax=Halorientalis litorea TaxID=2931977 RepID=UPI001FF20D7C|nr:CoA ester lyase [Halorientalis litorea]